MPARPNHSSVVSDRSSDSKVRSYTRNNVVSWRRVHPEFHTIMRHLQDPIIPLIPHNAFIAPAEFPTSILEYHLLTHTQLDNLARGFHQVWPAVPETLLYPARMRPWIGTPDESRIDIHTKRLRFGYFIGLGDCRLVAGDETIRSGRSREQAGEETQVDRTPFRLISNFLDSLGHRSGSEVVWQMLHEMEQEWEGAMARARAERNRWVGPKSLF